ncbi:MAG: DUF3450 domain-containing protein [Gammaproteobacteria bacterium]
MRNTKPLVAGIALLLALTAAPAWSQSGLEPAIQAGKQRIRAAQAAQDQIDALSDEIRSSVDEYRALQKEIEGLEIYTAQLSRQIESQQEEVGQLEESIDNVTLVERQITPLMLRMIDALEQFVALDMPFLQDERRARVGGLQELVDRADVTVAEKFRNVLEAYLQELEYGRTIEAWRGTVQVNGGQQEVDLLRIGRVGMFYRSLDGRTGGVWDANTRDWIDADAGTRIQIDRGLRIARQQAAPDLLRLPFETPESTS